jgi:hypothetical protein
MLFDEGGGNAANDNDACHDDTVFRRRSRKDALTMKTISSDEYNNSIRTLLRRSNETNTTSNKPFVTLRQLQAACDAFNYALRDKQQKHRTCHNHYFPSRATAVSTTFDSVPTKTYGSVTTTTISTTTSPTATHFFTMVEINQLFDSFQFITDPIHRQHLIQTLCFFGRMRETKKRLHDKTPNYFTSMT